MLFLDWAVMGAVTGTIIWWSVMHWPLTTSSSGRPTPLYGAVFVCVVACVFALLAALQSGLELLLTVIVFGLLALLFLLDVLYRRIPNVIVLPALVGALALGWWRGALEAWLGAAFALGLFYSLALAGERLYGHPVLGMGDVKLAALIGALLGLVPGLYALALSILLAGAVALFVIRQGADRRQVTLPYGAALAAGAMIVLVAQGWVG